MPINKKYSFNGYDPETEEIKLKFNKIKNDFINKIISIKERSERITKVKKGNKGKIFISEPIENFNDSDIIGSNFSQPNPYTDVFPVGIQNVNFVNCNLNNCNLPENCTLINSINHQIVMQNDGEYWIIDNDLNPISPLLPG